MRGLDVLGWVLWKEVYWGALLQRSNGAEEGAELDAFATWAALPEPGAELSGTEVRTLGFCTPIVEAGCPWRWGVTLDGATPSCQRLFPGGD